MAMPETQRPVERAAPADAKQELDERLDEELRETFPASDPLPWTHKSD